jgi:hypothetical protein
MKKTIPSWILWTVETERFDDRKIGGPHQNYFSVPNFSVYLRVWPERPDDGEIELRSSFDTDRMWHCAYIGRKPAPHLGFSGLDQ